MAYTFLPQKFPLYGDVCQACTRTQAGKQLNALLMLRKQATMILMLVYTDKFETNYQIKHLHYNAHFIGLPRRQG